MSTPSESAAGLLAESGLTANQLGRLTGVAGRTFQYWASGSTPSSGDAKRLAELHDLVAGLPAATPPQRRALLLDSANGQSLFHRFYAATPRAQQIQFPVPLLERLGIG